MTPSTRSCCDRPHFGLCRHQLDAIAVRQKGNRRSSSLVVVSNAQIRLAPTEGLRPLIWPVAFRPFVR